MKDKKKIMIGTVIVLVGIVQLIAVSLFISNKQELRILGAISSGILGACLVAGIGLIRRGRNSETDKQKRIEEHDERNQFIQGKASYISLCITDVLILFFGAYVFYILEKEIAGWICYSIGMGAWIIYGIAYKLINRRV